MNAFDRRVTFGLLVASRNIFNGALAVEARRQLLGQLDRLGLGQVILVPGVLTLLADLFTIGAFTVFLYLSLE